MIDERDVVEITRDPDGRVKYVVINGNMIWDCWRGKSTDCCICKDDPDNILRKHDRERIFDPTRH